MSMVRISAHFRIGLNRGVSARLMDAVHITHETTDYSSAPGVEKFIYYNLNMKASEARGMGTNRRKI